VTQLLYINMDLRPSNGPESNSVDCKIWLINAPTLLVGRQEGIQSIKKLGVGLLVVMTLDWGLARLIAPVVITTSIIVTLIKSRMETIWYWLTQVHLGKWVLKWRERNTAGEGIQDQHQ